MDHTEVHSVTNLPLSRCFSQLQSATLLWAGELAQNRRAWSASVRDVVNAISDADGSKSKYGHVAAKRTALSRAINRPRKHADHLLILHGTHMLKRALASHTPTAEHSSRLGGLMQTDTATRPD